METGVKNSVGSRAGGGTFRNTAVTNAADSSLRRAASSRARPYVLLVLLTGCVVLSRSIAEFSTQPPTCRMVAARRADADQRLRGAEDSNGYGELLDF